MEEQRAAELLARERARVQSALAGLAGDQDDELSHIDQHVADAGSALHQREVDAGLVEQLQGELAAIERAEGRLADGTYGRSVESGDPIPDGRLELVPWAERTAPEQSRLERGA